MPEAEGIADIPGRNGKLPLKFTERAPLLLPRTAGTMGLWFYVSVRAAPMKDLIEELRQRQAVSLEHGGAERMARQQNQGKLTARERVDLYFDADG